MHVKIHLPGARATDPRRSATFRDVGLAQPLTLHFLLIGDTDTPGDFEMRCVGLELGEAVTMDEAGLATPELTSSTVRRIAARFPHWQELARAHLNFSPEPSHHDAVKRVKPARLDADWFRMVAAEYQRHVDDGEPAPVTTIAAAYNVDVSTASRWVKKARERGLIKDEVST